MPPHPAGTRSPDQIRLEAWVTGVAAILSLTGSSVIVATLLRRRRAFWQRFPIVSPLLLRLSLFDVIFSCCVCIEFLPPATSASARPLTGDACVAMAAVFQLSQLLSFSAYTTIAVYSFLILRRVVHKSWAPVQRRPLLEAAGIVIVPVVCTGLPLVTSSYGPDPDASLFECWLPGNRNLMRLTFYVPLFLALLVAVFLLLYALSVRGAIVAQSGARTTVLLRLASFVGVFIVCWTLPLVDRGYELISGKESPFALELAHACTGALFGFGNFCVWIASRPFQEAGCVWLCSAAARDGRSGVTLTSQATDDNDPEPFDTEDELEALLKPSVTYGYATCSPSLVGTSPTPY